MTVFDQPALGERPLIMQLMNSRQICSLQCTSQRQAWSCRGHATVRRQAPGRKGSRAQPGRLQRSMIRAEQQKGSTKVCYMHEGFTTNLCAASWLSGCRELQSSTE